MLMGTTHQTKQEDPSQADVLFQWTTTLSLRESTIHTRYQVPEQKTVHVSELFCSTSTPWINIQIELGTIDQAGSFKPYTPVFTLVSGLGLFRPRHVTLNQAFTPPLPIMNHSIAIRIRTNRKAKVTVGWYGQHKWQT